MSNWIPLSEDGRLKKQVITPATSDASPPIGAKVAVHYIGTLKTNGKKFDSSRDRGQPFIFTLGLGEVIRGWDLGVKSMKKGEKSNFEIPSDYAYGSREIPNLIPSNSTLMFEIELLSWKSGIGICVPGFSSFDVRLPPGISKEKMLPQVKDHLTNTLGIHVSDDWLQQCTHFVLTEELEPFRRSNVTAVREAVYRQFLSSDLDRCGRKPSPHHAIFSTLDERHGEILKGPFVLQINDIVDAGIPMVDQIDMEKELVAKDGEEMDEADALFTDALQTEIQGNSKSKKNEQQFSYSKRLLRLTLSNGQVNDIQAMEYKPIDALSLRTELGAKVRISNVLVRRGVLLLIPESIVLLGGGVDELIEAKKVFKSNLASKRSGKLELKQQIESNIAQHLRNAGQNPPQHSSGVKKESSTAAVKKEEEDEDLVFLDEDDSNIIDASSDEEYHLSHKKVKR